MTENEERSRDPILNDREYGPDLSHIGPAKRRMIGFGMIAAFLGVILLALLTS